MSTNPLWDWYEAGGQREPYLSNPYMILTNPPRRRAKAIKAAKPEKQRSNPMRKIRRGRRRQPAALAAYWAKRKRTNPVGRPFRRLRRRVRRAVSRVRHYVRRRRTNPVRYMSRRGRSYRRNPVEFLGFDLTSLAIGAGAVMVSPLVESQLLSVLPASIGGTTAGRWAVKIGTAAGLSYGCRQLLGPRAGNMVMLVLGANLVNNAVAEFAPSIPAMLSPRQGFYTRNLGYYTRRGLSGGPVVFARQSRGAGYRLPAMNAFLPATADPLAATW